jgi:1,4-alpha-glucan branching enzyme
MKSLFVPFGMLSVMLFLGSGCSTTRDHTSAGIASAPSGSQDEAAPAPAASSIHTAPIAVSPSEPTTTTERQYIVEFKIKAPDASKVYLAGEFNSWSETDMPMTKQANGEWTASIALKPGSYQYKFIIDDQWTSDPDNSERVDDGYNGFNSVIQIPDSNGNP